MPTALGKATFEALMEARERFNELSSQLSDTEKDRDSIEARELQRRWQEAFIEFEATTNRFHKIVQMYRDEIVRQVNKAG
jgi:uncharacterized protein YukE